MESLSGIIAFVRTAETLSFVAAARTLGVSASAVGKNVANLERSLGVRLFQRSTRRVGLTDEGALFYERCRRVLDDLREAQDLLSRSALTPRGKLRISLPAAGYFFLMRILPEFSERFPEVELDLDFDDRMRDPVEDGIDIVIRSGDLPDSRLISRRLQSFRFVLCASDRYLGRHGTPQFVADLAHHKCLRFRFPTTGKLQSWQFPSNYAGQELPATLICNNIDAIRVAAIEGLGIAYVPDFLVRDALKSNELRTVLDNEQISPGQFWALWPSNRYLSPRVRVFVEFIVARLSERP